ncbi:MAG: MopE-related protein [Candidatus Magasanikbacteria bacterium]
MSKRKLTVAMTVIMAVVLMAVLGCDPRDRFGNETKAATVAPWCDLNSDAVCDTFEDVNDDGACNQADCLLLGAGEGLVCDFTSPEAFDSSVACPDGGLAYACAYDNDGDGVGDEAAGEMETCTGPQGQAGTDGTDGTDGASGANGQSTVCDYDNPEVDPVGCPNGGFAYACGLDVNSNGELDAGEEMGSQLACTGADGQDGEDGLNTICADPVTADPADCPDGGWTHVCGLDANSNGVLDAGEEQVEYDTCNGADGNPGQDGDDCASYTLPNGCIYFVCALNPPSGAYCQPEDGHDAVFGDKFVEPAGPNCEFGGNGIEYGIDLNDNGILDANEVIGAMYSCAGASGQDGHDSLVKQTEEPAGPNCEFGGIKFESGVDSNDNGILDADEVDSTSYVCKPESTVIIPPENFDDDGDCYCEEAPCEGSAIEQCLGQLLPGDCDDDPSDEDYILCWRESTQDMEIRHLVEGCRTGFAFVLLTDESTYVHPGVPESLNGKDDNCNGVIDEDFCADDNDCADPTPYCHPMDGICVACHNDAQCDDGDPCTVDTCNVDTCVYSNEVDGTPCSDALFCNGAETCQAGVCEAGDDPCDVGEVCSESLNTCEVPIGPDYDGDGYSVAEGDCDDDGATGSSPARWCENDATELRLLVIDFSPTATTAPVCPSGYTQTMITDGSALNNPAMHDTVGDGVDNDCDGTLDEGGNDLCTWVSLGGLAWQVVCPFMNP